MKHTMLALTMAAALAGTSAAAFAQSGGRTGSSANPENMNGTSSTANQPGETSGTTMSGNVTDKNLAAKSGRSSDKVKQIQSALEQKGQHVTVDGRWGKQTAAAVRNFQKQNGLKATGKADSQTMQKLGLTSG
ncbi:MAG TPA: peptidoglycan-binding domain-containing protein [Alphaproteobacteria bacterium]|nr:peptidoglycan-binding domain-containing protein [Alphaproteobacteria bacterium]